jgi:hypothetical protein
MQTFKKVGTKPLVYAGEINHTPERVHYLVCCPIDKVELRHLKLRATLRGEPEPKSPWKIHFYCYCLPDMQHRQTILYFKKDFAISPLVASSHLAESCTKFLFSQILEVASGNLPPRVKSNPRNLLLPGIPGEQHWRAIVTAALQKEVERMPEGALFK